MKIAILISAFLLSPVITQETDLNRNISVVQLNTPREIGLSDTTQNIDFNEEYYVIAFGHHYKDMKQASLDLKKLNTFSEMAGNSTKFAITQIGEYFFIIINNEFQNQPTEEKLNEQTTTIKLFCNCMGDSFLTNNKINPKPDGSDKSFDCDNIPVKLIFVKSL
jgi:hypothetical protein